MPKVGKKKILTKGEIKTLLELEAKYDAVEFELLKRGYTENLYRKLREVEIRIATITGDW